MWFLQLKCYDGKYCGIHCHVHIISKVYNDTENGDYGEAANKLFMIVVISIVVYISTLINGLGFLFRTC